KNRHANGPTLVGSGRCRHPFFCASGMLVGADDAAVQEQPFQVRVLQILEDPLPNSFVGPAIEAFPHRVPIAEPLGKITPRGAGLRDPKDRVHEQSIVRRSHARIAFLAGQKILDAFPLVVGDRVATKHGGPSLARGKWTRSLPTSPGYCPHSLAYRAARFLLVPKLPFGNAGSRNSVSLCRSRRHGGPESASKRSFEEVRSQTGVWERGNYCLYREALLCPG